MRRLFLFLVLILFGSFLLGEAFAANLTTRSISGTEFKLLSNTDQCLSNCEAWIEWDLSKGIVSNVQLPVKQNSQFGFELVKKYGSKGLEDFGVEVWEEIKGEWRKVSDSFYGFEATKGKIYRLRVWGTKKASLVENNVDWIPTFFGERITEWAWWNSNWNTKFSINSMVVPVDLNIVNWVNIEKVDLSALNLFCADADDLSIVNEATLTEVSDLNFQGWDGTNTDSDVNLLFKLTEPLPAATYEGEYYIYTNNPACVPPTNRVIDELAFDDFEDGDNNLSTRWYVLDGLGNTVTTVEGGAAARFGSFGTKITGGAGDRINWRTDTFLQSGEPRPPYTVCAWMKTNDVLIDTMKVQVLGGAVNVLFMGFENGTFYGSTGATVFIGWATTPVNDTWYKFCGTNDRTTVTISIYDAAETIIESWDLGTVRTNEITSTHLLFTGNGVGQIGYFDNVTVSKPRSPTYVLGGAEIEVALPDLNITTINGLSFLTNPSFAFGIDGNVTVDFNIFIADNNRATIDLNHSQSTIQGTGMVIVKDLNLTSDICPDQDWDDVPSKCSVQFNYSELVDGNHTIIGLLNSVNGSDFNAADGNFQVVNDVNLVVLIPIDEESYELIDLNVYSFRVSYSDGNNSFIFSDLNEPLFLNVPIGTTILTFEIDTNSSDYFKRGYFINFITATGLVQLQPYLIKTVPAGGGGIQSVLFTRTENNKAVPNIEIRAYKIVPNFGKSLMEQLVTDAAGSATFSFVQGGLYTLDFLRDGNIFSSDLVLRPVFSSYQFYLSAEVFTVPDENALIFDVNYSPSLNYIDSNTWADINISINVENTIISDLNILIYLDDNTLFNVIVFVDGFYALPPVSIVGATKILNVEVILTTADGLRLSRSKAYSYNLSVQQSGLNEFFEDLPGLVNFVRNSIHLEISTLGFLLFTIFICGAIKSKSQIDTGGLALFGLLLMGVFTYLELVYLPAFLVAVIIAFALVIFSRSF